MVIIGTIVIEVFVPLWTYANAARDVVLLCGALALIAFGIAIGRKVTAYRARIICLMHVFSGLVLLFALLYVMVAKRSPESFRVADVMLDSRVREDLDHDRAELSNQARLELAAGVIGANSDTVLSILRDHGHGPIGWAGYSARRVLTAGLSFRHLIALMSSGNGAPIVVHTFTVEDERGNLIARFQEGLVGQSDVSSNMSHDLLYASTSADIVAASRRLQAEVKRSQERTLRHMDSIIMRRTSLDVSHYIYFSAGIMTTIGSSDISPASRLTRYLVTFQAFVAVFFLGFALNVLWPRATTE